MTRLGLFCITVSFAAAGSIAAADGAGQVYGSRAAAAEQVATLELLNNPEKYVGKTVRVEGRISAVCPRRGCWIDIVGEGDSRSLRFKVDDDVIVFPLETQGKSVVAEGVFVKRELPHEEAVRYAQHLAEEQGEEFDPASVTGPLTLYQIDGQGAVVDPR